MIRLPVCRRNGSRTRRWWAGGCPGRGRSGPCRPDRSVGPLHNFGGGSAEKPAVGVDRNGMHIDAWAEGCDRVVARRIKPGYISPLTDLTSSTVAVGGFGMLRVAASHRHLIALKDCHGQIRLYSSSCLMTPELGVWCAARDANPQLPDQWAGALRPRGSPEWYLGSSGQVPSPARPPESRLVLAGGLTPGLTPTEQAGIGLRVKEAGGQGADSGDTGGAVAAVGHRRWREVDAD
jgi:hypothetical protein